MFRSLHISILSVLSALSAVSLAAPTPQDYNNVDWGNALKSVDWNTVNYGGSTPTTPAQVPTSTSTTYVQGQSQTTTVQDQTPTTVATPSSTSTIPPSTPSPSPSPSPSSSSGGGATASSTPTSGKRGLAYNPDSPSLDIFSGYSGIGWGWDWASSRGKLPSNYEFVPMLWSPDRHEQFDKDVQASGASYLLSFNEPDISSQANIPVADAVSAHCQYMNPHSSSAKIGAVSVSNGKQSDPSKPPMGLDYLKAFLDQCGQQSEPCAVDFCPVHWYGCDVNNHCDAATDFGYFQEAIQGAIDTCNGKPIWITEFQKIGSEAEQKDFLDKALPWLDGQEKVERYSYFMVSDGIMTNGGSLNSVGTTFASA